MKKGMTRIWQIVYPLIVYYLLYHLFFSFFAFVFSKAQNQLLFLGLASMATIPFILVIYKKLPLIREEDGLHFEKLPVAILGIIGIIFLGMALNYLISNTMLVDISKGYANANQTLYQGDFITKVLANCMAIPILEELVFRGIVCNQIQVWYGNKSAILLSALCFGMMHFNLVQFCYGFLMGLALGGLYLKTRRLWTVVMAHGLTNFVVLCFVYFS